MVSRRQFITAMKKNGYAYDTKGNVLTRNRLGLTDQGKFKVVIWLGKRGPYGQDYANIRVWALDEHNDYKAEVIMGRQDLIPFDHTVLTIALIDNVQRHWATQAIKATA